MPRHRRTRKRTTRKRVSRRKSSRRKSSNKISNQMITYIPKGMWSPFPPAYRTKFHCNITGAVPAGAVGASYCTSVNRLFLPYASNVWGSVSDWPGMLGPLTTSTINPIGLTQLLGNTTGSTSPYQNYRVYKSTITVQLLPGSDVDNIDVTIVPVPISSVASSSYDAALMQPYSKTKMFSANQLGRPLSNSISVSKLWGIRPQAIKDDLTTQFTGSETGGPSQTGVWHVWVQTPDNVALAADVSYRVSMTYYAELWQQRGYDLPVV
nr:MAG: capsid protein [Cressdnaviricota sp.]